MSHCTLNTVIRRFSAGRGWLVLAVLAAGLGTGTAALADMSLAKPVGQLFNGDSSRLSPAGERWLRGQVAQTARQPEQLVVVQVPGATPALQRQRADAIRARLAALGVAQSKIYLEAGPSATPRLAGL